MDRDDLSATGITLGVFSAIATFVASWWYCASEYGFLFGFGLGWLPSGILAVLVFFAVVALWRPVALFLVCVIVVLLMWLIATCYERGVAYQRQGFARPGGDLPQGTATDYSLPGHSS